MNTKRVCLFTGASGRLGTVFCKEHAEDYEIAAVYRRHPPEGSVFPIQADLTNESERQRVVEATLEKFGRIDLLVNSAVHSIWGPMLEPSPLLGSASSQFQTNVIVPLQLAVLCARSFWCERRTQNREENRNIINVSSIAGSKVYPRLGQGVYAASKAALDQLSRHMADEFRSVGVRVNSLAPNSFPRIIPTSVVAQALRKLDLGQMTGRVLIVDRDGETLK